MAGDTLRIAQLVHSPQRRGAEVFAHALAEELRERGHETQIWYVYDTSGERQLPLGVDDSCLGGFPGGLFERLPGWQPRLVLRLRSHLRAYRPDVLQMNGSRTVRYGTLAGWISRGRSWRLVHRSIGEPNAWTGHGVKPQVRSRLLLQIDGIIAVSQASLRGLQVSRRRPPVVEVIPNAVDPGSLRVWRTRSEARALLDTGSEAVVVVWVGSLTPEKRLDRALRVVAAARRQVPGIVLWVVGDGPRAGEAREMSREMGVDGAVRFVGAVDDVGTYLGAADAYLLTSDTEGIPGALLEACCAELPPVATDVGGVSEVITDRETGFLVSPDDENGIARRLVELARSSDLRTSIGARAAARARECFSMSVIADRYEAFYRKVLARR